MSRTPLFASLALLAACDPTYIPTNNYRSQQTPLWDAEHPVVAGGELFLGLPASGGVARLAPGTEPVVDVDPARPVVALIADAAATHAVARRRAVRCAPDDGPTPRRLDECPDAWRQPTSFYDQLAPAGSTASVEAEPWYTDVSLSPDGRYAVAPIDPTADTSKGGVVSLTAVLVVDLQTGTATTVSVGFQANRILFTTGSGDATTGMVVLSRSEVAIVDLTQAVPVTRVTFPLTLDNSVTINPSDVALTPDETHAFITVDNSSDLYILDLVDPSINLVALSGSPERMAVDPVSDQTVFVYSNRSVVDVIDHDLFDVATLALDVPATRVLQGPDFALLWSPGFSTDVVRLDEDALRIDTYRLTWLPDKLFLAPDGDFAIALGTDGGAGRMEVLDLRAIDGRVDTSTKPFALRGPGLDVAFAQEADGVRVLLLQEGVDTLFDLSWPSLQVGSLELPAPPIALGALDDTTFWITHVDGTGQVSFLTDGALETWGGFAATDFLAPTLVYVDEEAP